MPWPSSSHHSRTFRLSFSFRYHSTLRGHRIILVGEDVTDRHCCYSFTRIHTTHVYSLSLIIIYLFITFTLSIHHGVRKRRA